jgi:hypothetical protein
VSKRIPEGGIQDDSLREAAAGELHQVMALLRGALRAHLNLGTDSYVGIEAFYPDRLVVSGEPGKLLAYPYTLGDDNKVTFGAPVEVVTEHKPVFREAVDSIFVEALDGKNGSKFRIRVIRAGLSGNKTLYPDTVLREATPLFNGVRVFVKSDEEHLKGKGKDFRV